MNSSCLQVFIKRIPNEGRILKVNCSLVCDEGSYLEVLPEDEVRWVYPDENLIYEIKSNVNWNIQ